VTWPKPRKPWTIDQASYDALPEPLVVRECRARVDRPGFRVRSLVVATTLADPAEVTAGDPAGLYRRRWSAEKDQADCRSSGRL